MNQVSLTLREGEIVGLIGPNGAGKSTTIGGILGLLPITSGTLQFESWTLGQGDEIPAEMKRRLAFIPEQPMYYGDLTLKEHFDWKLRLWGESGQDSVQARLDALVQQFQLQPHLDKFPHQCSKGTLQKLMIVSAFMFSFDVLIIDEPFIGLDVLAIRQLRILIESARRDGASILVSTHVLDSAEKMCQRFVFMMDGSVFASGSLNDLRQTQASFGPDISLEDLFISLLEERRGSVD